MGDAKRKEEAVQAAPTKEEGAGAGGEASAGGGRVAMRFDRLCKRIYAFQRMVIDWAECFLTPETWALLDWTTLQAVDSEHVSDSNRSRRSDLVWTVRYADGKNWLCFVLEFQSRVDPLMVLRFHDAAGMVLGKLDQAGRPWPVVKPVVFHTGRGPWTAPRSLDDFYARQPQDVWRDRPQLRYSVVDLLRYRGRGLRRQGNFASSLFRIIAARNVEAAWRELRELQQLARDEGEERLGNTIAELFVHLAKLRKLRRLLDELHKLLGDDKVTLEGVNRAMEEIPEISWREPIVEEGRKQGREEGRKELLAKQAEARFGRQHARTLSKLLRSVESVGRLDEVGLWLVECDNFDTLATRLKTA